MLSKVFTFLGLVVVFFVAFVFTTPQSPLDNNTQATKNIEEHNVAIKTTETAVDNNINIDTIDIKKEYFLQKVNNANYNKFETDDFSFQYLNNFEVKEYKNIYFLENLIDKSIGFQILKTTHF